MTMTTSDDGSGRTGLTSVFWLARPALVDVLAATGSAVTVCPSYGDAGSGRGR